MQGAQSLYQMSRLSTAADDVAASSKFSGEVRNLWARFLDTENALKQVTAFMDTASADEYRKDFDQSRRRYATRLAYCNPVPAAISRRAPARSREGRCLAGHCGQARRN